MSENCSHNCSSCGETCASRTMESFRVPLNPQSSVKKSNWCSQRQGRRRKIPGDIPDGM